MKASLACLFLAISSLYCHSQEQASNALALEHSSSLATISTAVRVVSSVTEVNLVDRTRVELAGVDLGTPVRLLDNPTIGGVPLPARGILIATTRPSSASLARNT